MRTNGIGISRDAERNRDVEKGVTRPRHAGGAPCDDAAEEPERFLRCTRSHMICGALLTVLVAAGSATTIWYFATN